MRNKQKHIFRSLCLIIALFNGLWTYAQFNSSAFKLHAPQRQRIQAESIHVAKDTVIDLHIPGSIYGLSVSGVSYLTEEDGYIRILLKDNYKYEFLVYETFSLLSDSLISGFNEVAMETVSLDAVTPVSLRIELSHANVELLDIQYSTSASERSYANSSGKRSQQQSEIVDQLNRRLSEEGMLWRADVTSFSEKSYEEKKASFGGHLPALYGFEYYRGGIFTIPGAKPSPGSADAPSPYVKEIDWRNRHGRNWLTPVKDQRPCGSCWAFNAVGAVEAYVNLYFNRLLYLDLSEQELISCLGGENGCLGGETNQALNYLKVYGVVEESCFSYKAQKVECGAKCESFKEKISIESYDSLNYLVDDEDCIKKALLRSPICFENQTLGHGLVLAGYRVISVGDSVFFQTPSGERWEIIASYHPLVGRSAWLLKNSWGDEWGINGYVYLGISDWIEVRKILALYGKVTSLVYDDSDIVCEDRDGDGYFFWGIGPKPRNLPLWAQEEPDGDDSNPDVGSMDSWGHLKLLNADLLQPISIRETTRWDVDRYVVYNHLFIEANATLTVSSHVFRHKNSKIVVKSGGTLIVDGGKLERGHIRVESGGHLVIKNEGVILRAGGELEIEKGASLDIMNGEIL